MLEDKKIESVGMRNNAYGSKELIVNDFLSMALSTVIDRAFQNVILFVYHEGKKCPEEEDTRTNSDVTKL